MTDEASHSESPQPSPNIPSLNVDGSELTTNEPSDSELPQPAPNPLDGGEPEPTTDGSPHPSHNITSFDGGEPEPSANEPSDSALPQPAPNPPSLDGGESEPTTEEPPNHESPNPSHNTISFDGGESEPSANEPSDSALPQPAPNPPSLDGGESEPTTEEPPNHESPNPSHNTISLDGGESEPSANEPSDSALPQPAPNPPSLDGGESEPTTEEPPNHESPNPSHNTISFDGGESEPTANEPSDSELPQPSPNPPSHDGEPEPTTDEPPNHESLNPSHNTISLDGGESEPTTPAILPTTTTIEPSNHKSSQPSPTSSLDGGEPEPTTDEPSNLESDPTTDQPSNHESPHPSHSAISLDGGESEPTIPAIHPSFTTIEPSNPESPHLRPLNILSLDGGGNRGYSELLILDHIMKQLKTAEDSKTPLPCEVFDLICGTSTGGLIALMLGRLRMSVEDALERYKKFSKLVFGDKKPFHLIRVLSGRTVYNAKTLEEYFKTVVSEYDQASVLLRDPLDEDRLCRTFVVAVPASAVGSPQLLRTYGTPSCDPDDCEVWEAARATTAASRFFNPIVMGTPPQKYCDEAFSEANNPSELALREIEQIFLDRQIGCFLSLGTGFSAADPYRKIYMSCEAVDQQVYGQLMREGGSSQYLPDAYFRFSIDNGLEDTPPDEWDRLDDMAEITDKYFIQSRNSTEASRCVEKLKAK